MSVRPLRHAHTKLSLRLFYATLTLPAASTFSFTVILVSRRIRTRSSVQPLIPAVYHRTPLSYLSEDGRGNGSHACRTNPTVYHDNESVREHMTKVTNLQPFTELPQEEQSLFKTGNDQTQVVELGETIFYVQGGGQPFDTGSISSSKHGQEQTFNVEAVRYGAGGRVLHFGQFSSSSTFAEGETVSLKIDGERRDTNSRVHTAGHLIGLAVRNLTASTPDLKDVTELKASHYPGACFVDFKGLISGDHKASIESTANSFVSSNLPIKIDWYAPDELKENGVITADGMPIIASGASGKVRVVDIVSAGPGGSRGAYPCGGTHVPETGKVGKVVVRNIKRQKGNSKISYEVTDG